jgi:hypothetical protein
MFALKNNKLIHFIKQLFHGQTIIQFMKTINNHSLIIIIHRI